MDTGRSSWSPVESLRITHSGSQKKTSLPLLYVKLPLSLDNGSLADIVLVLPFWAVVSAMDLLGTGPFPGRDWLALFTPSERPGPSSLHPSRHHALVLGLRGLVHRRASRLAAIAARPRPASTRTALEVSICCLSICCPGLVCWQHFPLATDPTVASNPESRSTAIIVLVCLVGLTNRHPRTYTTFSSCTILYSAFGLCLHSEVHIPIIFCASVHPYNHNSRLALLSPVARAPSSRSALFTARTKRETKLAVATRRAPRPAASSPAVRMPSCRNPAENPAGSRAKQPQPADPIPLVYTARA